MAWRDKKTVEFARSQFMRKMKKLAKRNPEKRVSVIVKLDRDLPQVAAEVKELGVEVKHEYKLIDAFSTEVSVNQVVLLEKKSWVAKIEEDKGVYTSEE